MTVLCPREMKEEEKDRHKAYMDTFKRLNAKLHTDRLCI